MSGETAPTANRDALHAAALAVLQVTERTLGEVGRRVGSFTDRLQLRIRAWRLALDPETGAWLDEARRSVADGSAKEVAVSEGELLRMMEERRRRLA